MEGEQELKLPKCCLLVMASRPDVMQLLFFFLSSEKHRLTRKRGGEV